MSNIVNHQRLKLQWDITSHLSEWLPLKKKKKQTQIIVVGQVVEKGESLYTVGGDVNV